VASPAAEGEWEILYGNNDAAKGWEDLCRTAPGNTRAAWQDMRTRPRMRDHRHGPLRGKLAAGQLGGRQMDRWQIEVTGSARVWYLIDDDRRTIWLVHAGPGHPKAAE
jgi:hypothetical protein